ncbi:unnamed protein product, partial [Pylaiella littoralis]
LFSLAIAGRLPAVVFFGRVLVTFGVFCHRPLRPLHRRHEFSCYSHFAFFLLTSVCIHGTHFHHVCLGGVWPCFFFQLHFVALFSLPFGHFFGFISYSSTPAFSLLA